MRGQSQPSRSLRPFTSPPRWQIVELLAHTLSRSHTFSLSHILTLTHSHSHTFSLRVVSFLLQCGDDPNPQDHSGKTPLHIAAAMGNSRTSCTHPHALTPSHSHTFSLSHILTLTPSHSHTFSLRVVSFLLQCGDDPNPQDHSGKTPLHIAAAMGNREIVELLLAHTLSRSHTFSLTLTHSHTFSLTLIPSHSHTSHIQSCFVFVAMRGRSQPSGSLRQNPSSHRRRDGK
jgi:ankyrin repeat protein